MKIHPRKIIRDRAASHIRCAVLDAWQTYDLTSAEMAYILAETVRTYAGYAMDDDPEAHKKPGKGTAQGGR